MKMVSSSAWGVVVKTISILGLQDALSFTGAPTWAAISLTCLVKNFTASGLTPAVIGHTPSLQRASLSATRVGTVIVPTKSLTAFLTSLIPVTVMFSVGEAGGVGAFCATAGMPKRYPASAGTAKNVRQ